MKKKQNVNCKNPSRNYLGLLINQFSVHLFATYANSRRIFIFFFFFLRPKNASVANYERERAQWFTQI